MNEQYKQFIDLVSEMRQAQIDFYKNRSQSNLKNALRLEKEVDRALVKIKATTEQLPLF